MGNITKLTNFSGSEQEAYEEWLGSGQAPIPLVVALKMYELYLNGYTCTQIARANGNEFEVGAIVDACLRHKWDKKKAEHLSAAYGNVQEKIINGKSTAINLITNLLVAAEKKIGRKLEAYIQSGDDEQVAGMGLDNLKNLAQMVSLFQTLTEVKGQSGAPQAPLKVEGKVEHVHIEAKGEVVSSKKLKGKDAHKALNSILAEGEVVENE